MAYPDRVRWFAAGLAALMAPIAQAQTPSPAPMPSGSKPAAPKPVAPDPAFDAAKASYEALPEAERKALQDALVWAGDYNSVVTGTYGRRTHDALLAYAARTGGREPGFPAPATRAALLAAGEAARKAARFSVKRDAASGVTLGVPERLLPKRSVVPGGTRWQSANGGITLDTKSFPSGETDLDALFTRITAPMPDRKVTYKIKRPDFLVVTAETAQGKSYIRYAAGAEGIRGFTIGYGRDAATEVDRLVIAIANSFVPFEAAAPATGPARSPAPSAALPPIVMPPLDVARRAPAATGLVVGPDRVLTSAKALAGCADPSIGGTAARIAASDPASGLAFLEWARPEGKATSTGPTARAAEPPDGEALVVLSAESGGAVAAAPGEALGAGVSAPLQPGAGGAPVFDRSGNLVGLVASFPASPRLIAGVAPPTRYAMIPGAAAAAFLAGNGIAPGSSNPAGGSVGAVAARFGALVVGIACSR